MSHEKRVKLVVIYTAQMQVLIWLPLTIFGFLYADGKPGTNWFNDETY